MALSAELMIRLNGSNGFDEPLPKRLKLAENVFYSFNVPIVCKEDNIINWLCNELIKTDTSENSKLIWSTIYRCLSIEQKNFLKLSPEVKDLLLETLIKALDSFHTLNEYQEILNCCKHIFLCSNYQNYLSKIKHFQLIKSLIIFTNNQIMANDANIDKDFVLNIVSQVISIFADICNENFCDKVKCLITFIEEALFPLSSLIKLINDKNITCNLNFESQKCIKRIFFKDIKICSQSTAEQKENVIDNDEYFMALKKKCEEADIEQLKVTTSYLFQCAINTFQRSSSVIHTVLLKLVDCVNKKEASNQILTILLEASSDISYNFENRVKDVTFELYLKNHISEILNQTQKCNNTDYKLLSAISNLNPLLVEDMTKFILERILFEKKKEQDKDAYEELIMSLWKASVKMKRQNKFITELLLVIDSLKEDKLNEIYIDDYHLPERFITEFMQDLKLNTTSFQIMTIFKTLLHHLKADCLESLKKNGVTRSFSLLFQVIIQLFIKFFENSHFLDSNLPVDWHKRFLNNLKEFGNEILSIFENICLKTNTKAEAILLKPLINAAIIWTKVYGLFKIYLPNLLTEDFKYLLSKPELKKLYECVMKCEDEDCNYLWGKLLFHKEIYYLQEKELSLKPKIIPDIWAEIIENHFNKLGILNEEQIFLIATNLIQDLKFSKHSLKKWIKIFKDNYFNLPKVFTTAIVLQILKCLGEELNNCCTKSIIENIDTVNFLKSLNNEDYSTKFLKKIKKEINKGKFNSVDITDSKHLKKMFALLSYLPLSFLDKHIRIAMFLILFCFEKETGNSNIYKESIKSFYIDLLGQNDINVLEKISDSSKILEHFLDNQAILYKLFKLSLDDLVSFDIWENIIDNCKSLEANLKTSSTLLNCLNTYKFNSLEKKKYAQKLINKLNVIMITGVKENLIDLNEIVGLRITLKNIITQKNEIDEAFQKNLERTLQKCIKSINVNTDAKLIEELYLFFSIILNHRNEIKISDELTKQICLHVIEIPCKKTFSNFFEGLQDKEFTFFVKSLCHVTKHCLAQGNNTHLEKLTVIWECLSKAPASINRSKICSSMILNLFEDLLVMKIESKSYIYLFKIMSSVTVSKRMIKLTGATIDIMFLISMESLDKLDESSKLISCIEALETCKTLLRGKTSLILDRLPLLINFFKKLLKIALEAFDENILIDQQLRMFAINIEKFCAFFAKLKQDVARISPYLIADILDISMKAGLLPSYFKLSLETSISYLLTNCDKHAISFLSRTLPSTTQLLFKTYYSNYVKYNKFTGKI